MTYGLTQVSSPHVVVEPIVKPVFALPEPLRARSAVLFSGRAYYAYMNEVLAGVDNGRLRNMGDALLGITFDQKVLGPHNSSWSNNDLYWGAEYQAPFFAHALHLGDRPVTVQAAASKFPWAFPDGTGRIKENDIHYHVGADSQLIGVEQPQLLGGGYLGSSQVPSAQEYVCVGSSGADAQGALKSGGAPYPTCPRAGTKQVIASAEVDIPAGHDGVLLMLAKTRIQADSKDPGGNAFVGIRVDGVDGGSVGVQGIGAGSANSQRTIAASFLAAGQRRLQPGKHQIEVWVRAQGQFVHLAATADLPLIYFD
jgi:hypothetical protein